MIEGMTARVFSFSDVPHGALVPFFGVSSLLRLCGFAMWCNEATCELWWAAPDVSSCGCITLRACAKGLAPLTLDTAAGC